MFIIVTYAPTADCDNDSIEDSYVNLNKAFNYTKNRDTNLIMEDFNAEIGEGKIPGVVEKFGLGIRKRKTNSVLKISHNEY